MPFAYAYEREPYRQDLATVVLKWAHDREQPYVVLEDTVLYPEGGGQPADRGWIGEVAVVEVQKGDDGVRHYVAGPVAAGPALVRLDWSRRYDHMQQHTAQHLLSAIAQDRHGWATTSFHLGVEVCDVELATPALTPADLEALEEEVAAEVRAARPVVARRVSQEAYAALPGVRSRGLPPAHEGDVRLVEIEAVDLSTCGGTHLASTAEIEAVKLLGTEPMRGGTRLYWLAGRRVRRRLSAHEARNAEIRALLGTGDAELVSLARTKLDQLKEALKRERDLTDRLADAAADALAAGPGAVVEGHFDGVEGGFLQRVARRFSRAAPGKAALLTATGPKGHAFALVAGEGSPVDLQAAGQEVARLLEGRGGGSGRVYQGTAGSFSRREEALGMLAAALASR
jgi:Ser-tRNA(Ala) deacylase AlaX